MCLLDYQTKAILHSDHPPYNHWQSRLVPYLKWIVLPRTASLWLPRKHNKCRLEMHDQATRRLECRSPHCLTPQPQELAGVAVWIETPESFLSISQSVNSTSKFFFTFLFSGEEPRPKPFFSSLPYYCLTLRGEHVALLGIMLQWMHGSSRASLRCSTPRQPGRWSCPSSSPIYSWQDEHCADIFLDYRIRKVNGNTSTLTMCYIYIYILYICILLLLFFKYFHISHFHNTVLT